MPGLAMSRSIGDAMAKTVGVIADPEIQIYEYDSNSNLMAIIVASDGIWDMFESNEIGQLMKKFEDENSDTPMYPRDYVNQIMADAH